MRLSNNSPACARSAHPLAVLLAYRSASNRLKAIALYKILIINHNAIFGTTLAGLLKRADYQVEVASQLAERTQIGLAFAHQKQIGFDAR